MKNIVLLPFFLAGFCACKQEKKDSFSVTGDIKGIKAPYVYLHVPAGDSVKTDSAVISNGHFAFKGSVAEPGMAYLDTKDRYIELFLENADIRVTGNMDSLDKLKITGSASQAEYDSLKASIADITTQEDSLYQQYDNASRKKDSVTGAAIEARLDSLREQRRGRIYVYIAAHPKSPVSVYEISSMTIGVDYPRLKTLYSSLDTAAQNSEGGRSLGKRLAILSKSAIGQPVIDFTQNDMNGRPVTFSQYNRGKYVFLDFWASWCGPCRGENPNVLKAYNRFKDQGLAVLGVSLDDDSAKWKQAVRQDGMPWTQVSDLKGWKNEVAQQYGIQGIPFNFLVDPSGIIIAKDLRGMALEQKLSEFLKPANK
jgi:peroxiredoxin